MKNKFKVKKAVQTVKDVYVNGTLLIEGCDYNLENNAIIVSPGLEKGEKLTYIQKTTIII